MPKPLQLMFNYERDTKTKVRFRENGSDAVGVLYLRQDEYNLLGKPGAIVVTIEHKV